MDNWFRNRFALVRKIAKDNEVDPYWLAHNFAIISLNPKKQHPANLVQAKKDIRVLEPLKKSTINKKCTLAALEGFEPFKQKEYDDFLNKHSGGNFYSDF